MKTPAKTIAVLIAGLISQTRAGPTSKLPTVIVYVQHNLHEPPPQTVFCAERLASAMFDQAGVQVSWRMGAPKKSATDRPISINITNSRPSQAIDPRALAYALAFEGIHITILWDRLESAAQRGTPVSLLAHVLVHEITHVLQRVERHSKEGVMKAHWTPDDVWLMARKPLPFDQLGMQLIQDGLTTRSEAR